MAKEGTAEAAEQRIRIASLINEGKGTREISRLLGCSPTTVTRVRKLMEDPNSDVAADRRATNGRPEEFTTETKEAILAMRQTTGLGPRLMWGLILKDPEKWGIKDRSQIPSAATIHEWLSEARMTQKMVGAKDNRGFPIDFEDKPGILAMDEWGPYHVRGERVFMVTAQDRFTRLSFGIPVFKKGSLQTWMRVMDVAAEHLLNGTYPHALWVDNGVGMALAQGWTPQPVRYALSKGTRVVFNAPHAPWKNGRLENWHSRQETEYWRLIDTSKVSVKDAVGGFLDYVNWYNVERPQGGLRDMDGQKVVNKSPADLAPWYTPITMQDIGEAADYPHLEPQGGTIDMIRMVRNNGMIDLQYGETMYVSEVFGGQWLRIRFNLDPDAEQQIGEVIWQRGQKKEPLTVATFNHGIDRKRERGEKLVHSVRNVDFDINSYPPPRLIPRLTNSSSTRQQPGLESGSAKRAKIRAEIFKFIDALQRKLTEEIYEMDLAEEDRQILLLDMYDMLYSMIERVFPEAA